MDVCTLLLSQHRAAVLLLSCPHSALGSAPPGSMDLLKGDQAEASPSPAGLTGHHDAGRFHLPSLLPQATWADPRPPRADGPRAGRDEEGADKHHQWVGKGRAPMRGSASAAPPRPLTLRGEGFWVLPLLPSSMVLPASPLSALQLLGALNR